MKKEANRKMKRAAARILTGIAVCTMVVGAAGCGTGKGTDSGTYVTDFKLSDSTEDLTGQYRKVRDYGDVPVTDSFRRSYMDFSLELLRESREEGSENLMVSPLSVMMALEMTRSGARGETEKEMARTLYGEALPEEIYQELMAYLQSLPNQEEARFHYANSIWFNNGDTGFLADENFLENSAEDYGAEIYGAPFDENTLKDINGWVEQETEGMIPDILEKISDNAIMYLINAMAFEAQWQEPYTTNQVHDSEFFPEEGEPQAVKMMYSTEGFLLEDETAKGFLKPYAEGYHFVALLPEEGTSMDEYLEGLSGEDFMDMLDQAKKGVVETGIPKFSAETQMNLNQILMDMGMPLAFDELQADFSGMGKDAGGNIFISQVIHSTFIQVDELGTKAGAATVVEMAEGAAELSEQVILNRPFLYAIVDRESSLPIFLGIMENAEER